MFSGIISDVGNIIRVENRAGGLRLTILTHALDMTDVILGDSIAVSGVCLTVVQVDGKYFAVDVSRETLNCTVGLTTQNTNVNLEQALRLADRLGGHLVGGHVDGVGEVLEFSDLGESWKLSVLAPSALAKFIAMKGSITINGVSLTVNEISDSTFNVNLIPHTLAVTNLHEIRAGTKVNLEIDLIARYVARILSMQT